MVWPETMVGNQNQLAKTDQQDILRKLSAEVHKDPEYKPFGNGKSAEKIVKIISKYKLE